MCGIKRFMMRGLVNNMESRVRERLMMEIMGRVECRMDYTEV